VLALTGTAAAAAGFAILTVRAFPVPGDVVMAPAIGVLAVAAGAILLWVDLLSPLRARDRASDP